MYCPECRSEFRDDAGLTACVDCGGPLLDGDLPETPEPMEDHTRLDLVTVLETVDPGIQGIAYALLDEAGIPYKAPGEGLQELVGMGRVTTRPVEIRVRRQDEAAAKDLLADLGVGSPPEAASAVKEETD